MDGGGVDQIQDVSAVAYHAHVDAKMESVQSERQVNNPDIVHLV